MNADTQSSDRGPLRVLSLDGGGVRGLYTAALLRQLCARLGPSRRESGGAWDLGAQFDLVVGTSTGSIVAVALAAGVPLQAVIELYKVKSTRIFQNPMPTADDGVWAFIKWVVGRRSSAANNPAALRSALRDVLHDETMRELYARRPIALCIPSIEASSQKGWVFKTPHLGRLSRDDSTTLVDVCMASSAAPIVFPLHGIHNARPESGTTNWFVDGGLWANNPILVALAEALEMAKGRPIQVISVGTGGANKASCVTPQNANRGLWAWTGGVGVVDMSLAAQASTVSYLASRVAEAIPNLTLYRLDDPVVTLDEAPYLGLDSVSDDAIELLQKRASRAADMNISALTQGEDDPTKQAVRNVFASMKLLGD